MTSKGRYKGNEWKEFEETTDDKGNKKQSVYIVIRKSGKKLRDLENT